MGNVGVRDKGLIGGVIQDDGAVLVGIVHPHLQLLPGGHRAGGVVGEAEINDVHLLLGGLGHKAVGLYAGHIHQAAPPAQLGYKVPGPARHGVGVYIHRIDGVAHGHHIVHVEDVPDVAAVALCAVGDEDLLGLDVHAPLLIVELGDGLPQEGIALLGAVAMEALIGPLLVHRLVHGLYHGGDQGAGHVADGQLDDLGLGMGGGVGGDAPGHLGKQIAAGQL